jgi:hypothetical protein
MTHSLDFPSVSEKLFLLRQLSSGSREYCKNGNILKGSHPYGDDDWRDYAFQLKKLASGYLIETAVKTRIFQDSIHGKVRPSDIREADTYARKDCDIGVVHAGKFALTVRESCNKIIHATTVDLSWANSSVKRPYRRYTYWTGKFHLHGDHSGKSWHVELDVPNWCVAVDFYLDHLWGCTDPDDLSFE